MTEPSIFITGYGNGPGTCEIGGVKLSLYPFWGANKTLNLYVIREIPMLAEGVTASGTKISLKVRRYEVFTIWGKCDLQLGVHSTHPRIHKRGTTSTREQSVKLVGEKSGARRAASWDHELKHVVNKWLHATVLAGPSGVKKERNPLPESVEWETRCTDNFGLEGHFDAGVTYLASPASERDYWDVLDKFGKRVVCSKSRFEVVARDVDGIDCFGQWDRNSKTCQRCQISSECRNERDLAIPF